MKIKYWVTALCLTGFLAGCQKTESGRSGGDEGFRLTASALQTKASIGDDGLSIQWDKDDKIQLVNNTSDQSYELAIDQGSIDGSKADFVYGGGQIAAGNYRVVYAPAGWSHTADAIALDFGDVSTSHADKKKDAVQYAHLFSGVVAVGEGATTANASLSHLGALLEIPVTMTSNGTGGPVTINSVSIADKAGNKVFPTTLSIAKSTGAVTTAGVNTDVVKVELTDAPALTVNVPYTVHLMIAPASVGAAEVTVSTSAGDFTFDKAAKTFAVGHRYKLSGLSIAPVTRSATVNSQQDWNTAMQSAAGPMNITLGTDVTLDASATFPAYPITVSGAHTLTIPAVSPQGRAATADVVIPTGNSTRTIASSLVLAGGAKLAVNGGILYGKSLSLGNGSEVSGTGRLVLSGELTVPAGATASIAAGFIASCETLSNAGTLNNAGTLYYGTGGDDVVNAVSKAEAQIPYSNFDSWYSQKKGNYYSHYIGPEDGATVTDWASGNGDARGIGSMGLYMSDKGCPTQGDAVNKVSGKSVYMFSSFATVSLAKKFAAGNLFLGSYDKTTMWFSPSIGGAALMTFGVSYDKKPVALTGYYRYEGGKIDYQNNAPSPGGDDQCDLYIVLAKKAYKVDTDLGEHGKSEDHTDGYPGGSTGDFVSDADVLAYGRLTSAEATDGFKKFRIELTYKGDDFDPAEATHIILSACSSKDGGKFTGSTSSKMWLDELELEF